MDWTTAISGTLSILCWAFVLTLLQAFAQYVWFSKRLRSTSSSSSPHVWFLDAPTIVAAPLLISVGFRVFQTSVLFPIGFDRDVSAIVYKAFLPALLIVLSSGVAGRITAATREEVALWRSRPCWTATLGFGLNPMRRFARVVIPSVWLGSWQLATPLFLAELLVAEALFNVRGLADIAWRSAKGRELAVFFQCVGAFAILSITLTTCLSILVKKRAERLATFA